MSEATYYQILQVDPGASKEVIEAAYRRLAKMYHPDVNKSPDAARRMQAINEAYQVLRDPVARFQYDGTLKWREPQPTYPVQPKPQATSDSHGLDDKAWLAYQKRVRGGYLIKIGKADDFGGTLETLKFRVPVSARRYDPSQKHWFVAEQYAHVLADLFYDFQSESLDGDLLSQLQYENPNPLHATYQSAQPKATTSKPSTRTAHTPHRQFNGAWLLLAIVGFLVWFYWPTGNLSGGTGARQPTIPPPAASESEQPEPAGAVPRLGVAESGDAEPLSLACPHVVNTAVALEEPRLSATLRYTITVNVCLDIEPIGREVNGVPWYELADGAWLRATLVENQPHWAFEQDTAVIPREPDTTSPLATAVRNANVRSGPCLNHAVVRGVTHGATLPIVGYSRDASHVWYALRDGGWVREDLVRNAPTVPEVSAPACPSPPVPSSPTSVSLTSAPTMAQGCPGGCTTFPAFCAPPIKGNISFNTGEKIYHLPGQQYYDATNISPHDGERWFCTEVEARAAGWRRALR